MGPTSEIMPKNAPANGAATVNAPSDALVGENAEITTFPAVDPAKTSKPIAFGEPANVMLNVSAKAFGPRVLLVVPVPAKPALRMTMFG
jgi:hypothetical protein